MGIVCQKDTCLFAKSPTAMEATLIYASLDIVDVAINNLITQSRHQNENVGGV